MKEKELYIPMKIWLEKYLKTKYKKSKIIVEDTSQITLDKALSKHNIEVEQAKGLNIQIDVLGIVKSGSDVRLFFIEAKTTRLTIRDLGQLWVYCKLINPTEGFLLTNKDLGALKKILELYSREDLLDFGDGKQIKKIKVGIWNNTTSSPDFNTMLPKI